MGKHADDSVFAYVLNRVVQDGPSTRAVQYFECCCLGCGATLDFSVNRSPRPPDQLAKMASKKGWVIDLKRGQHLCPDHARKPDMTTVEDEHMTLTRELKRVIFREIDSCYDGANLRYHEPHTDESVAAALGVKAIWVAELREDAFGPAGPSPEVLRYREKIKELERLKDDAETTVLKATEAVEALSTALEELRLQVEAM